MARNRSSRPSVPRRRPRQRNGRSNLAAPAAPIRRRRVRRTRGAVSSLGMQVVPAVLDARRTAHLPAPLASSAYTVVRTRSVTNVATNAFGQRTVLIAGQWKDGAATPQENTLPFHAIFGVGTGVPGTTETIVGDPLLSGAAAGTYQLAMHAMTVVVTADGSATSGTGTFYMGTIPSRIARTGFATWNVLGTNLLSRREMLPITAYQSLSDSERYSTRSLFPMDMITWQEFSPSASNTTGSAIQLDDSLSPCFIVWEPTTTSVNYNVSIFVEWRVIYNSDVQLASTAIPHKASSVQSWQSIINTATTLSGNLHPLIAGVGSMLGGIAGVGSGASLSGASGNLGSILGSSALGLGDLMASPASIALKGGGGSLGSAFMSALSFL